MANTQQVVPETLRSLAFGGISASYAVVGTALTYAARIVCFTNQTNGDLFLSVDGTNNHFFLAANSFKLFDLNSNRLEHDPYFAFVPGTQFFVKQSTAPTSGSIYIEALYGAKHEAVV